MANLIFDRLRLIDDNLAFNKTQQYRLYKSFIKMVHQTCDEERLAILNQHIDSNKFPIQFALQVVYECDQQALELTTKEGVSTYDPQYDGCKLF